MKEQRKVQMKAHPWLYRILWVCFMIGFICFLVSMYQATRRDMIYLSILCFIIWIGLCICFFHNRTVRKQQLIHQNDLKRELYHRHEI